MRLATTSALSWARVFSRRSRSRVDGGRMKTLTRSSRADCASCCVPCQSISNSTSRPSQRASLATWPARRAVVIVEDLGVFQELAAVDHQVEIGAVDEMIVDAVTLAGRFGRVVAETDKAKLRLQLQQPARNRGLAGARRRRQHQHQPAPLDVDKAGWSRRLQVMIPRCRTSLDILDLLAQLFDRLP